MHSNLTLFSRYKWNGTSGVPYVAVIVVVIVESGDRRGGRDGTSGVPYVAVIVESGDRRGEWNGTSGVPYVAVES